MFLPSQLCSSMYKHEQASCHGRCHLMSARVCGWKGIRHKRVWPVMRHGRGQDRGAPCILADVEGIPQGDGVVCMGVGVFVGKRKGDGGQFDNSVIPVSVSVGSRPCADWWERNMGRKSVGF